jgi:tRNA(Ile)-lysidine synthase
METILALAARGGTGYVDLPGGVRLTVEYGRASIARDAVAGEAVRLGVPGRVAFAGGEVVCELGAFAIADGTLDAAALASDLEVRSWRAGDRMRPLGLGGTKSLQDLFTDRKVPRAERHRLPVVLADGEIAWVPGVATGERFRARGGEGLRARLTWRPRT